MGKNNARYRPLAERQTRFIQATAPNGQRRGRRRGCHRSTAPLVRSITWEATSTGTPRTTTRGRERDQQPPSRCTAGGSLISTRQFSQEQPITSPTICAAARRGRVDTNDQLSGRGHRDDRSPFRPALSQRPIAQLCRERVYHAAYQLNSRFCGPAAGAVSAPVQS